MIAEETIAKKRRLVTPSDLLLTVPRIDAENPMAEPALALTDILDEANAKAIVAHLLLRTPQSPVTGPNDGDFESKIVAKDFWALDWDDPNLRPGGRGDVGLRRCAEELSAWSVGAIRFAPSEALLPGAASDWRRVSGGAPVANGIQLRFSIRNNCEQDDAGIHVIYVLTPKESTGIATLPGQVEAAFLAGDKDKGRALAREFFALSSSPGYGVFHDRTVDDWLALVDGISAENVEASKQMDSLPEAFLKAYKQKGLTAMLSSILHPLLGDRKELGIPALATRDSKSSKALREGISSLIKAKGQLVTATVFFGSGMDAWNFGKLVPNQERVLAPSLLRTVDTFLSGPKTSLADIDVRETSRAGLYETVGEFLYTDGERGEALFSQAVPNWDDFRKTNVLFTADPKRVSFGEKHGATIESDNAAELAMRVMAVDDTNSSNMACSVCHGSIATKSEGFGPKKSGVFEMLNGKGEQMNTRTAAELLFEVETLNKAR